MNSPRKKNNCPDCFQCHWCSDDRCHLCLRTDCQGRRKLSMAEQIARFEERNRTPAPDPAEQTRETDGSGERPVFS